MGESQSSSLPLFLTEVIPLLCHTLPTMIMLFRHSSEGSETLDDKLKLPKHCAQTILFYCTMFIHSRFFFYHSDGELL